MKQPEPTNGARSESLLPAADEESAHDDSLHVAEEVNLDQQSDRVRQIGNLPEDGVRTPAGPVADALAKTLSDSPPEHAPETGNLARRQ